LLDGQLVFVFPVVHQPADRRFGIWGDLDEVQIELFGEPKRLVDLLDPYLGSIGCNYPYFFGPDRTVDTQLSDIYFLLAVSDIYLSSKKQQAYGLLLLHPDRSGCGLDLDSLGRAGGRVGKQQLPLLLLDLCSSL
jgi:hypothetical protein